jgi:hypothetical protein
VVRRALLATGDLLVPKAFTIPKDDASWAKDLWGVKLGKKVNSIRIRNAYSDYMQELDDMGFDFDPQPTGVRHLFSK